MLRNKFKQILKKIIFSMIPLVFLVISCELILYFFPIYPNINKAQKKSDLVMPDKDLIWKLTPNINGKEVVNSLGFRDTTYNAGADFTILLLGDSVSWGDSIGDVSLVYPQILESSLNSSYHSVEVINASVPGYSTFQELLLLKKYGDRFNSDYILLQICLNDITERYNTIASYGGGNSFLGIDTRSSFRGIFKLTKYSRIIETIVRYKQQQARRDETYKVENLIEENYSQDMEDAWKLMLSEVMEIKRIADKRQIPMLAILTPYRFQINQSNELNTKPQDIISGFCKINNIDFIDFLPIFQEVNEDLFVDANHLSKKGHWFVAFYLQEYFFGVIKKHQMKISTDEN